MAQTDIKGHLRNKRAPYELKTNMYLTQCIEGLNKKDRFFGDKVFSRII